MMKADWAIAEQESLIAALDVIDILSDIARHPGDEQDHCDDRKRLSLAMARFAECSDRLDQEKG